MKAMIGKFIRDEWNNGDYSQTWLRRIVSETPTTYVCHIQRIVKDWSVQPYEYVFPAKRAIKYRKTDNELGFKDIVTRRTNTDGKSTLSLVDDLKTLKCIYTLDELFKTDVREFQTPDMFPRKMIEDREARALKNNEKFNEKDYMMATHTQLKSSDVEKYNEWDAKITKYLEDSFGCPVYYYYETIVEHHTVSKLTKSGTFMHINHFGGDKKALTSDENYFNRTILFWYFGDKIIFTYKDGHN